MKQKKVQFPNILARLTTFSLLLSLQACAVVSVADSAVSAAVDVVGMGVHAASSAIDAILPSPKK